MLNNAIINDDEQRAAERRQAKREAADNNGTNLLNEMANNDLVRVKESGVPGVVACNFTRKAFYKGAWDEQTVRARGLFLDKNTGAVVARGYDKFFNVGQSGAPATIRDLAEEAQRAAKNDERAGASPSDANTTASSPSRRSLTAASLSYPRATSPRTRGRRSASCAPRSATLAASDCADSSQA